MSSLIRESVIAVALILACGCANQSINQTPAHEVSRSETGKKIKTYQVRFHYLKLGNTFTEVQHTVAGNISIDLENNQFLWGPIPLQLVTLREPTQGQKIFFDGRQLIYITGQSPDRNNAVGLIFGGPAHGQTFIQICQTPHGSYSAYIGQYLRLNSLIINRRRNTR